MDELIKVRDFSHIHNNQRVFTQKEAQDMHNLLKAFAFSYTTGESLAVISLKQQAFNMVTK